MQHTETCIYVHDLLWLLTLHHDGANQHQPIGSKLRISGYKENHQYLGCKLLHEIEIITIHKIYVSHDKTVDEQKDTK